METVPLVWMDVNLAVPPIQGKKRGILNVSVTVLVALDNNTFRRGFYYHDEAVFMDGTTGDRLDNVIHWAKVILPKSKKYNELSFEFINNN